MVTVTGQGDNPRYTPLFRSCRYEVGGIFLAPGGFQEDVFSMQAAFGRVEHMIKTKQRNDQKDVGIFRGPGMTEAHKGFPWSLQLFFLEGRPLR